MKAGSIDAQWPWYKGGTLSAGQLNELHFRASHCYLNVSRGVTKHKFLMSRLKAKILCATSFDSLLHDTAYNRCSIKFYNIYLEKLDSLFCKWAFSY